MTTSSTSQLPYDTPQWVCIECGFNMIGAMPEKCPFCGADHTRFISWEKAEKSYCLKSYTVNSYVSQLLSEPKLGLAHFAYRVKTDQGAIWIDSPSVFNRELAPVQAILFTHHHFLGASNQYGRLWNAPLWLHELDAKHHLAASYAIDLAFSDDFNPFGIEAYHIGGHTPGFTLYIYRDVLFICDYVFIEGSDMSFNPYGSKQETRNRAIRIHGIVAARSLKTVCGYNYIADFSDWIVRFERLIQKS